MLSRGLSPEPAWFFAPLKFSRGREPAMPLSPCRCSDGPHSSGLLRAVAQLRAQLRAHLLRAPPAPSRRPSAWCWVGGVLLGPVLWSKCPRLCLVALCEAEEPPPAGSPCVGDSHFNWKLFWQFLRPHLLVLAVAVVVRCPSPFPHTRAGKDPAGGLQKRQPELPGDGLSASPSLRIDLRKQQALAASGTGSRGAPGDPARGSSVCGVQESPGTGSLGWDSEKHRGSQMRTAAGEGGQGQGQGWGRIWPPLKVCPPPPEAGTGCGPGECADPPAPGPAGGDRGQVHAGPRG